MPPGGAFRVLLLLLGGASAVAPPEGLKLTCHNHQVTVSWNAIEPRPHTSYRVHVQSTEGNHTGETTGNQYDLTPFVWASEDRYRAFYCVDVTAREGGNESEPVRSETFTFNHDKPAHIKCEFDFPPVDLKETDSGATLSFQNPFSFYRDLDKTAGSKSLTLEFTATSNGKDFPFDCNARDDVCRLALPPGGPAGQICVSKLEGNTYPDRTVKFREAGPVCAVDSAGESESESLWAPDGGVLALSLMLLLFLVVTSVVIVLICRAKAWTMKGDLAKPPMSLVLRPHEGNLRYVLVQREHVSPVTAMENLACRKPSVGSEEELPPSRPEGGLSEDEDEDKTDTASIDMSHYDRRQTLEVDMGDGEVATGYSNRGDDL